MSTYTPTDALKHLGALLGFYRERATCADAAGEIQICENLLAELGEHLRHFGDAAPIYSCGSPTSTRAEYPDGSTYVFTYHPDPQNPKNAARMLHDTVLADGRRVRVALLRPGEPLEVVVNSDTRS
jgi:hypothetical protein